jgi:hypothetical protein
MLFRNSRFVIRRCFQTYFSIPDGREVNCTKLTDAFFFVPTRSGVDVSLTNEGFVCISHFLTTPHCPPAKLYPALTASSFVLKKITFGDSLAIS